MNHLSTLKFITCGSVDDGKSTLIGRLLIDSKAVLQDQLAGVSKSGTADLALFTDGLSAEREQGITIDVAYRYFNTPSRKFIIGDAPGHEQYTRNMVTAASSADAAVVLVGKVLACHCCRKPAATACWCTCCACLAWCLPSISWMLWMTPRSRLKTSALHWLRLPKMLALR
jgi:translation initiation factor 2 gamma subunit (eIF-2gamma)